LTKLFGFVSLRLLPQVWRQKTINRSKMILVLALVLVGLLAFAAHELAESRGRTPWKWALLVGGSSFLFLPAGVVIFVVMTFSLKKKLPDGSLVDA